jgi:hypothetical protein
MLDGSCSRAMQTLRRPHHAGATGPIEAKQVRPRGTGQEPPAVELGVNAGRQASPHPNLARLPQPLVISTPLPEYSLIGLSHG